MKFIGILLLAGICATSAAIDGKSLMATRKLIFNLSLFIHIIFQIKFIFLNWKLQLNNCSISKSFIKICSLCFHVKVVEKMTNKLGNKIAPSSGINAQLIAFMERERCNFRCGWPHVGVPTLEPFFIEAISANIDYGVLIRTYVTRISSRHSLSQS